ncbi:pyridoxamine 5'-phosphate oxidase family protein [Pseudonocardia yunnanensis]|uniref:Pyridoxamine 5'-phosphate oxidase family protein n=1 Tax=Pseudonocardia yunnanensis TaxID=58107 RepID=A0ABW4ENF3_9PSEU
MTRSDPRGTAAVAELVELDRSECLRLLAQVDVGRIVFTEAAMPAAVPVHYLLEGEEVLFRAGGGRYFTAARPAVVGFQVDNLDPATRTGWSVLGVGQAYEVVDSARLAMITGGVPEGWAPGPAAHVVAVPLQHLTGHRLCPRRAAAG